MLTVQLQARRFVSTAGAVRGWREFLGWGTPQARSQPAAPPQDSRETPPTVSPTEHLKQLTRTLMPDYTGNWKRAPLNTTSKSKILVSCESAFDLKVANTKLGSLNSVGDVLKLFQTKSSKSPPSVFPNIVRNKLPSNLSIQYRTRVKAKPDHEHRPQFDSAKYR